MAGGALGAGRSLAHRTQDFLTGSGRATRTVVNGEVPSRRRDEAVSGFSAGESFQVDRRPRGSVVTETVSEITGITLVIVGSPGTYGSTATARSYASEYRRLQPAPPPARLEPSPIELWPLRQANHPPAASDQQRGDTPSTTAAPRSTPASHAASADGGAKQSADGFRCR